MDDADLLRDALDALKTPSLNTPALQARIASRLAEIYGGGSASSGAAVVPPRPVADPRLEGPLDATIPILPGG